MLSKWEKEYEKKVVRTSVPVVLKEKISIPEPPKFNHAESWNGEDLTKKE